MCDLSSCQANDSEEAEEMKGDNMKLECDIVKDLLPLYVEQIASEKSALAVEDYLKDCKDCKEIYEKMQIPESHIQYDRAPAENFHRFI